MTNRKYSAIVFDLGNVLLPFSYDVMIEKLNKVKPELGTNFFNYYHDNYHIHRDFERGKISEEEFLKEMLESLENMIDEETFCKFFSNIFTVNNGVAELLPELKKRYKLFLLSNTNSIHESYGWKDQDFLKHFDHLVVSHKAGFVKPEEEIYRAVEKVSGFPSEEHIFIDDIKEYVDAAKILGWDGIHFKGYEDLVKNFKQRNII